MNRIASLTVCICTYVRGSFSKDKAASQTDPDSSHCQSTCNRMSDQPQWLLLNPTHYPKASDFATLLGTIVQFYHEPQTNRTPTDPKRFAEDFYLNDSVLSDVVFSSGQAKKSALALKLEKLLSLQHSKQGTANFDFNSKVIRSMRLRDYDRVFDKHQEDNEVQKKLKEWLLPFGKAYMIVGALSFEDAKLEQSTVQNTNNTAHAQAPIHQAIAAQFGGVTSDETGNPTIDVSAEQDEHAQIAGTGIGTQIFALQYKVVRRTLVIGRLKSVSYTHLTLPTKRIV